eukprot:9903509-Alexandrium_andersonii.AAC.1
MASRRWCTRAPPCLISSPHSEQGARMRQLKDEVEQVRQRDAGGRPAREDGASGEAALSAAVP